MIKFLHLRPRKFNGQFINHGGITAAYVKEGEQQIKVEVAFAFCSHKENYCYAIGRAISKGRLIQNKPSYTVELLDGETIEQAIVRFVRQAGPGPDTPALDLRALVDLL